MIIKARTINIDINLLHRAAQNNELAIALAVNLIIKGNYISSRLNTYSLRDFMKLLHAGAASAAKARECALKYGVIQYEENPVTGNNTLVATKITKNSKKHTKTVRVSCCDSKFGKQFYIENHKKSNNKKYSEAISPQTLAQVVRLVRLCALMYSIGRYTAKYYSEIKTRVAAPENSCLKKIKGFSAPKGSEEWIQAIRTLLAMRCRKKCALRTGYSHQAMIERVFNSSITINKLRALLTQAKEDELLISFSNSICTSISFAKEIERRHKDDTKPQTVKEAWERSSRMYGEMLCEQAEHLFIESKDGKIIRMAGSDDDKAKYYGKGNNEGREYSRMANTYLSTCWLIGRKYSDREYQIRHSKASNKNAE